MSIFDLTGKKAIVTGGSRGLGHGMAEGLMEGGCEVVIIGTRESIKDRAAEFNQKGLKCTGVQADLGDEIALKEAIKKLNSREKLVLDLRFYKGRTQIEVADEIGISQAQVSRIEKNALKNMKKYI